MIRRPNYEYKTINKSKSFNVCAMCFSRCHPGALTVQQMKQHQCLKKNCTAFKQFDDHPYWEQRKNKKLRCKGLV